MKNVTNKAPKDWAMVHNRILIKPNREEDRTPGGIIIPETSRTPVVWGTVVAIGPDVKEVVPGDHILYGEHSGTSIEHDGEIYRIVREIECMARTEDPA